MRDDKSSRGQGRTRIDVSKPHELRDWAKKFGVTEDALKAAVQTVGDRADNVERHLKGKATAT